MANATSDGPVLCCADGSELSTAALRAGAALLGRDVPVVLVTVVEETDPTLVAGAGMAGGVMTPEQHDELEASIVAAGETVLAEVASELGWDLPDERRVVLRGGAGPTICAYAVETGARAIVIGSRGRGGLARAVLGSCSDHVVRNAPCSVVVTNADAA
jgi:nucleotide-binding universal stress UspA family protein